MAGNPSMSSVDQAEPLRFLKSLTRRRATSPPCVEAFRAAVRDEPAALVGVLEFWLNATPCDDHARDD